MKKLIVTSGLAIGGIMARCGATMACPACAQALDQANSPGTGSMTAAYETSILFMLSMPFILLAAFGFGFYRLYRKGLAATVSEPARPTAASAESVPALSPFA